MIGPLVVLDKTIGEASIIFFFDQNIGRLTRLFRMKTNLSSSFVVQRWQILFKFCLKIRRGLKKHWGKIKMAARVVSRVFWHPVSYCLKIRYAYAQPTSDSSSDFRARGHMTRELKNWFCNIGSKIIYYYWRSSIWWHKCNFFFIRLICYHHYLPPFVGYILVAANQGLGACIGWCKRASSIRYTQESSLHGGWLWLGRDALCTIFTILLTFL